MEPNIFTSNYDNSLDIPWLVPHSNSIEEGSSITLQNGIVMQAKTHYVLENAVFTVLTRSRLRRITRAFRKLLIIDSFSSGIAYPKMIGRGTRLHCDNTLDGFYNHYFGNTANSGSSHPSSGPTKENIPERLQLVKADLSVLKTLGVKFDAQLLLYSSTKDEIHLHNAVEILHKVKEVTERLIKAFYILLVLLPKRIPIGVRRDRRQHFRNQVRFLFKNMDDNSGDHNVLLPDLSKQSLNNYNLYYHGCEKYGYKGDYRLSGRLNKKRQRAVE